MTWIVTLCDRRGTYGTGLALVARLGPRWRWHAAAFCVAGVALCGIDLHFVWQAWRLMTWIVTLRGTRGTSGTGLALVARLGPRRRWDAAAFCVAGVALDDMDRHFAWQAWHLWHWVGSGGALGSHVSPWSPRLFAWQAWHLATCSCTLCGRHGTLRHPPSSGVARMALGWIWWRAGFPRVAVVAAAVCVAGVALGDT